MKPILLSSEHLRELLGDVPQRTQLVGDMQSKVSIAHVAHPSLYGIEHNHKLPLLHKGRQSGTTVPKLLYLAVCAAQALRDGGSLLNALDLQDVEDRVRQNLRRAMRDMYVNAFHRPGFKAGKSVAVMMIDSLMNNDRVRFKEEHVVMKGSDLAGSKTISVTTPSHADFSFSVPCYLIYALSAALTGTPSTWLRNSDFRIHSEVKQAGAYLRSYLSATVEVTGENTFSRKIQNILYATLFASLDLDNQANIILKEWVIDGVRQEV